MYKFCPAYYWGLPLFPTELHLREVSYLLYKKEIVPRLSHLYAHDHTRSQSLSGQTLSSTTMPARYDMPHMRHVYLSLCGAAMIRATAIATSDLRVSREGYHGLWVHLQFSEFPVDLALKILRYCRCLRYRLFSRLTSTVGETVALQFRFPVSGSSVVVPDSDMLPHTAIT
ncbi:hypothetical protein B0H10DRAFT_1939405 [Mycena sp. CBHHK59/15]|nr:hypothetical protein B0H10DRAFT_1939405 [Mycena sp. CBHHK59/15]